MLVDQNMCFADAPLCAQGSGSHPGDADSEEGDRAASQQRFSAHQFKVSQELQMLSPPVRINSIVTNF